MKTRALNFGSDEDRAMFPFIYQGFLAGGNAPTPRGVEVLRREARILDKLDEVSTEQGNERVLLPGPQQILLEQPEYELLKQYFENTPWTTRVSRQIIGIVDWLASIPLEENGG